MKEITIQIGKNQEEIPRENLTEGWYIGRGVENDEVEIFQLIDDYYMPGLQCYPTADECYHPLEDFIFYTKLDISIQE